VTAALSLQAAALLAGLAVGGGGSGGRPATAGPPPSLPRSANTTASPVVSTSTRGNGVTNAPSAGPDRMWADSATTEFTVAGIPVILRRVASNDVVSANVYLLGGLRQVTQRNAGIEPFLLDVSERGTAHYPRDVLLHVMARLGTSIQVDPTVDWTSLGVRATSGTFDSTWMVMADRLMEPRLDSVDVQLIREQYLSAIRQRGDSPDALLDCLADSAAYSGSPYGLPLVGTEQSISAMTSAELREYAATQMVRSRLLVVVVGNVTAAHVERLVRATLAQLPAGTYRWTLPTEPPPLTPALVARQRALPTNYILGYYHGPPASSPDYQALRLATSALSGQLFEEIRSRRNLTYAVNAPFLDRALSAGGLYVTTVAPDTVLAIMRYEVSVIQHGRVDPAALERLVQMFITQYFLDNETDADQADLLARATLYRGDYRAADRFVDELRRVTPADIQRVSQVYMRNIVFAYVGDTTRVSRAEVDAF
jgi:zinc protease